MPCHKELGPVLPVGPVMDLSLSRVCHAGLTCLASSLSLLLMVELTCELN